jgi:hypothetical protein
MAKDVAPKSKRLKKKFSGHRKAGSRPRKQPAKARSPQAEQTVLHHKASKRPNRLPSNRALKAAGLPPPAHIKPGSKAYTQLKNKWYSKLTQAGFEDLEWHDKSTGKGQNSDYLRGSAAKGRTWAPERAQFYRLLQNYLTHYQFGSMQDRYVMHRLNDGDTYRDILANCKAKYGLKRSLYWFYYYVQDLVKKMVQWNADHKEGLLNPANADSWADDALLSDLRGTSGVLEAPNGLKLDQGWWLENMADWWADNGGH